MYASENDSHAGLRSGAVSVFTHASKAAKSGAASAVGKSKGRARKDSTSGAGERLRTERIVGVVITNIAEENAENARAVSGPST